MPGPLPHHSHAEWIANGYLWRSYRCKEKGCGLLVAEYYWPNDPSYHVDPVTFRPHVEVCGDKQRVAAMIRSEDAKRKPVDGKSAAGGDR